MNTGISAPIFCNFFDPIVGVRRRDARTALASMTMPETALNKYHCISSWQNHIGAAGEFIVVQPESQAKLMSYSAKGDFWHRVPATHGAHNCTTLGSRFPHDQS